MEETTLTGIYAVIIIWAGFFIILLSVLPPNGIYSLSIDYTTEFNYLPSFFGTTIHNINIIDHPVNSDIIQFLLSYTDMAKRDVIYCAECKKINNEQSCFNNTGRKLVIMNFIDGKYSKGFPQIIKSNLNRTNSDVNTE